MKLNLSKCRRDFEYYAANCLKIKSEGKIIPLILNEPQRKINNIIEQRFKEGELQRYLILKARHEGVSTLFEGRNFWKAHMWPNTRSFIMAHEKDSAIGIFQMCSLFYTELPENIRPMTKYNSKRELYFANPDPKTEHQNPGLRSSIKVLTAGRDTIGRGLSFDAGGAHFSEVAFYPTPEETIDGILSVIPLTDSVVVAYESTANGVNNYFYDEWHDAIDGKSNYHPIFLAWFELGKYRYKFKTEVGKREFLSHLKPEEEELVAKFNLDAEQLLWRRLKIKDLRREKGKKFEQEFPSTPEEAFVLSGVPVFDRDKLDFIRQNHCKPALYRGQITVLGFVPCDAGELKIWEKPISDATYVVSVDASGGFEGESRDYACIQIFKLLKPPMLAEQVAEWHGKMDAFQLADVVKALGVWYNEALVVIEVYPSAHGATTQAALLKSYYNLYRQEKLDQYQPTIATRYGWETTARTKPAMQSFAVSCVGTMDTPTYVVLRSKELLRELGVFIKEGTAGGASTGHDDRVIAAMIGIYVMHEQYGSVAPNEITIQEKSNKIEIPKNYIDPDVYSLFLKDDDRELVDWTDY